MSIEKKGFRHLREGSYPLTRVVGTSVSKVDGYALVTGAPMYADDIAARDFPQRLHGKILTSPIAHGIITAIDTSAAEALPGVHLVLTWKNTPRTFFTTAGQGWPEPSPYDNQMFTERVRFVGDRVAAVFADSSEVADEAVKLIKVTFKEEPAVLSAEDAIRAGAPVVHPESSKGAYDAAHNIAAHVDVNIGDVDKALAESEVSVSETFETHYVQHTPMETHTAFAYMDDMGKLVIVSSTQVPWHSRRIVSRVLGIPMSRLRVIKPRIGGGYGCKQEILIDDLVAYGVIKTGLPCEVELTRREEFVSSRTRHPMKVDMSIGSDAQGNFKALKMHVLSNTGAYGSHSLTVMSNTGSKTLPLYNKARDVRFFGDAVYTNLPVAGAYRGYGATQGYAALETTIDDLAAKLNMDPIELRKKNMIRVGEGSPIFEALGEGREGVAQTIKSSSLPELLDLGAEAIGWKEKRGKRVRVGHKVRGVGMSMHMQGSGIPLIDMASASIKLNEDGTYFLTMGATDIGTGSDTILSQMAAEVLGVTADKISALSSDTDLTPFDVGAYASSTTFVSGGAVIKAAKAVRNQIFAVAAEIFGEELDASLVSAEPKVEHDDSERDPILSFYYMEDGNVVSVRSGKKVSVSEVAYRAFYEVNQHQIAATQSFVSPHSPPPFAAHFVEIELDELTGKIKILKYVAAVDCGVSVNPDLVRGQILGALANGIGFALTEEYHFGSHGNMTNSSLFDYKILSRRDMPPTEVIVVDSYEPTGPLGVKSVAEININGPVPAIGNAIFDATGIRLHKSPYTPEKVLAALHGKSI
ncbi:MAG: molybdopterin cofactor-binding domain-containing protein [Candidatus Cryosericum sp.]|nr:molybdopterin-dependent oxidoreductase [bacterium]